VAVGCVTGGAGRATAGEAGDVVDGTGAAGEIGRRVSDDGMSPGRALPTGAKKSIGCAEARPGAAARSGANPAPANISHWAIALASIPLGALPVTSVMPMLSAASAAIFAGPDNAGQPSEPINVQLVRSLAAIERATGVSALAARSAALAILAERDAALAAPIEVEPAVMTVETFQTHLAAVMRRLEALRDGTDLPRAA
jgi:hypothetical protein